MSNFEQDFLVSYSDDEIVSELQRVARVLSKNSLSRTDIDMHGRVNSGTVIKRFGSLRKALQVAGLRPVRFMKSSDDELLEMLIDLWTRTLEKEGRRPFRSDLKNYCFPVSGDTYVRKFGSWKAALVRAAERANEMGGIETDVGQSTGQMQETRPAQSEKRQALSIRKRFLVFKRDKYRCRICKAAGVELEVDHIVPAAEGGADALDNLQTLCFRCNRGKRDSIQ
jgi:HNH endonuclease